MTKRSDGGRNVQRSTSNVQRRSRCLLLERWKLNVGRWTFFSFLVAAFLASSVPQPASAEPEKFNVLILGDSLALCGFGKRLDERFRSRPDVAATYTYMACGTNPLSWLKQKPYTNIKAPCGYWSIESGDGSPHPREMQDTYGMGRGKAPKPHPVPKLDDLLATIQPQILIMQTGSNLFGLFPDAKTVRPNQHASALKTYLLPFKETAVTTPSPLRKIYWVNPPTSGRIGKDVQEFLFEQTRKELNPAGTVIDSRKLVAYPYKNMDPDKEHFLGEEMNQWADRVYEMIEQDLAARPLASTPPLSHQDHPLVAMAVPPAEPPVARALPVEDEPALRAEPVSTPPQPTPPPQPAKKKDPLQVKAKLVFKSQPIPMQELLPYQESLVGYVYQVEKVQKGEYDDSQILVMHPAHIALKEQKLKYKIGKRYKLRLDRVEGTLWETAKARDESGQIDLQPYIRVEDKNRHPQIQKR